MSGLRHDWSTAWRVVRAEGLRAALDRARDRALERRERRRMVAVSPGTLGRAPLVNLLATPPSPRLGGVQAQLRNRLALEVQERPCALLHPQGKGWRLEHRYRGESRVLETGDAPLHDAVGWALREVGAAAVHCEGVAGLSGEELGTLARQGARLVISVHDFALFCRRPHLVERPADRFCDYCRDLERCHACLRHDFEVEPGFQARYRERCADLLRSAEAAVYPSAFLREAHAALVPGLDPARQHVIEPGTPPVPGTVPGTRGAARAVRHAAWVGAVQVHKGALVFEEVVRRLDAFGSPLRWSALGGGDADLLARFRRLPRVGVRGYWRAGALPAVLRRRKVDLALLLSIWPEAYGLTLDECWRAGVPVVAFDHGAMAERIRRLGGGLLVPPSEGAAGVVRAVRAAAAGPLPPVPAPELLAEPRQAAAAHLDLYRRLGLVTGGSA